MSLRARQNDMADQGKSSRHTEFKLKTSLAKICHLILELASLGFQTVYIVSDLREQEVTRWAMGGENLMERETRVGGIRTPTPQSPYFELALDSSSR